MVSPRGVSLLFANKSSRIPGTHIIDLVMLKDRVNLKATQWFLIGNSLAHCTMTKNLPGTYQDLA